MPGFKATIPINAIPFDKPVENGDNLQALFQEIKNLLPSLSVFKLPDLTVDLLPIKEDTFTGFLLTFKLTGKEEEVKDAGENIQWLKNQGTEFVKLKMPGHKELGDYHIVFSTNAKNQLVGIATDFTPRVFRQLMLLIKAFQPFHDVLENTDYWVVHIQSASQMHQRYKVLSLGVSMLGGQLSPADRKSRIDALQVLAAGSLLMQSKQSMTAISGLVKIQKFAFKTAAQNGYKGTGVEFANPFLDANKEIVKRQIVPQLVAAKVLPDPGSLPEARLALFIDEGDGQNMAEILSKYPNMVGFATDMVPKYAEMLKGKFGKNRVFLLSVEEFKHLKNIFHYIFIFNYDVPSFQERSFETISELLIPGGTVVVGRSLNDPELLHGSRTIGQHLGQFFPKESVRLGQNSIKDTIKDGYRQVLYIASGNKIERKEALDVPSPLQQKINAIHQPYLTAAQQDIEEWNKETYAELERVQGELTLYAELEHMQVELTLAGKLGAAASALVPAAAAAVPGPVSPVPANPPLLSSTSLQPPKSAEATPLAAKSLEGQAPGAQASMNVLC